MEQELVDIFERPMTLLSSVRLTADEQNDSNIRTITIGEFVNPQWQLQYIEPIQAIRTLCPTLADKEQNKEDVDLLKKSLPAGIVSGVAINGIGEQSVTERNSVIPFDIDAKDNPALYDWEAVKSEISKSPFVAYTGLSVSALGVWGLIPVEDGMNHKEHFDAIVEDFASTTFCFMQGQDSEPTMLSGIKLDPAPSNVASKRFVSYDPHPYVNPAAKVYTKTVELVKPYEGNYTCSIGAAFDIEGFFKSHGISYTMRYRHGGTQYIVRCPWAHLHCSSSRADSAVFVSAEGKLGYKCLHAHCADKHWHQYREYYEPGVYNYHETLNCT